MIVSHGSTATKAVETFFADILLTSSSFLGIWCADAEMDHFTSTGLSEESVACGLDAPAPNGGDDAVLRLVVRDDPRQEQRTVTPCDLARVFATLHLCEALPDGYPLQWVPTAFGQQGSLPSPGWARRMLHAYRDAVKGDEYAAGEIDAGDADSLVQLAVFGCGVYG